MSYAYLGSPYSHPDPAVRELRFTLACKHAARLMDAGEAIFSPIAHSHPIDSHFESIGDLTFWMRQDIPLLRHADKLYVLMLPGWRESKGLAQEMKLAADLHIPIEYIPHDE